MLLRAAADNDQKEFPDYYETIKHPMSLEMVYAKLQGGQYASLGQVTTDLGTIWNNAKRCKCCLLSSAYVGRRAHN